MIILDKLFISEEIPMDKIKRRTFLKTSLVGSVAAIFTNSIQAKISTPSEMEGPFYPITPQKDQDADLTKVAGKTGTAQGKVIEVFGQVLDQALNPIEDVSIDLWQANSFGRYHHPHDTNEAPLDENFQAWAILQSGAEGRYRFKTIIPGAYPISSSRQRTPHIHFKISKKGYESLLTQMYFPNQELNDQDVLFNRKSAEQQAMMTAKKSDNSNIYQYNIIIDKL